MNRSFFNPGEGDPARCPLREIDLDAGRDVTDLATGIEQPRLANSVDPGPSGLEGGLVDVPTQDRSGRIASNQFRQHGIAVVALAGPAKGTLRRCVVHPDPPTAALLRGACQHVLDADTGMWPVPPRADGEKRVPNANRIAIDGEGSAANLVKPVRRLLALCVSRIEIVIAGTNQQSAFPCHRSKACRQRRDLNRAGDRQERIDVIASDDHRIETCSRANEPIVLTQLVVEV